MPDTADVLIEALREQCLIRGCNGIKGLSVIFRAMDIDFSKRICFEELRLGIERFGIQMSEGYLLELFKALDVNKSGGIDFSELMRKLRPAMPQCRRDVVNEAFDKMDVDKNGAMEVDDLKAEQKSDAKPLNL